MRRRSQRTLTLAEAGGASHEALLLWFVDSGDSQRTRRAEHVDDKPGGRTSRRSASVSSPVDLDHQELEDRPSSAKTCQRTRHRRLRLIVASKLILNWSPEQISGWLKRRYPSNENMRVSHGTIYRSLCRSRLEEC